MWGFGWLGGNDVGTPFAYKHVYMQKVYLHEKPIPLPMSNETCWLAH